MIVRVLRRLLRPLALIILGVLWLTLVAAAADTAVQIATAIMVIAPLVLPFILKYVPLDGAKMTVLAYAVSLVVALVAGFMAALFKGVTDVPGLIAAGTTVFGLMQLVFQLFKDHKTFGALLK